MRHRTSSSDGSSSTTSSPTTRQSTFNHPPRPTSLRSRTPASQRSHPSPFGPLATLLRLAIFAAILAFTVPYIKPYIFGSSSSTNSSSAADLVNNATGDLRAGKNSYHHIDNNHQVNTEKNNESRIEDEVDVFNFSHQDYLSSAKGLVKKDDGKSKKKDKAVAKASVVGVVAQSQPKTRGSSLVNRNKSNTRHTKQHSSSSFSSSNDLNDDQENSNNHHHNQIPSLTTISVTLSTLYTILHTLFRFILIIPLTHIFHFSLYLITSLYHLIRWGVSNVLGSISYISAPLTYLLAGIVFVFVSTPLDMVVRVVGELYPVYVFLGAAMVVGVVMGFCAAGVMYVSAFIFVDRVEGGKRMNELYH